VHKNGTWAAQKIIDVAKLPGQMSTICDNLRPYTVPLFLDQFGNYVLQCCLKFGAPYNNFIFETMLVKLWDIAQGMQSHPLSSLGSTLSIADETHFGDCPLSKLANFSCRPIRCSSYESLS
jgi:hypothetical protein